MVLDIAGLFLTRVKCKVGLHPYPHRWSNREKHSGAFGDEMYLQFKSCPECGAEKSRQV